MDDVGWMSEVRPRIERVTSLPDAPTDTTADQRIPDVDELLDLAVGELGGGRRDGQHRMAVAVGEAIEKGEHLLVQAGTGTGKSLGYLVPAVRHAVAAGSKVIISTATLALQRQVITRDLPLVAKAVTPRLPREPKIALLKGWHNYLCVHKIGGGYPADEPTLFDLPGGEDHPRTEETPGSGGARGRRKDDGATLADHVRRLHEWAGETDSGDRDDLVPGVPDRAWRQVSVTAMECLGGKCPMLAECFPDKARAASRDADVVVTNHAMLGIAATGSPGVLPEHDVVVVDEAHELTDRVTSSATVDLSMASVENAARLARRHAGTNTDTLDTAAQALGTLLVTAPAERFPNGLPDKLRTAVGAVRDAAREVLSTLKPDANGGKGQAAGQPEPGLKMAQGAMLQLFETAERMASQDTTADVLWCSRPDNGWGGFGDNVTRLHAAPLHVAGLIRTHLLGEATGVFTSATLALGGTFDPVAGTLGLKGEDAPPWQGLDAGSPFDYPRQGILYIARHLPAPGREPTTEAQLDEIAELITAAGGRTLGLFSSRRAANAAAEAMRERLDLRSWRRATTSSHPGTPVRGRPGHLPVRHAVAVAGRRRAGTVVPARADRPHPVPAAGRPGQGGPRPRRRAGGRQRVHGGVRAARGAAARAGRRAPGAEHGRPGSGSGPGPAARDRTVRVVPDPLDARVLAHHRLGAGPRRARQARYIVRGSA